MITICESEKESGLSVAHEIVRISNKLHDRIIHMYSTDHHTSTSSAFSAWKSYTVPDRQSDRESTRVKRVCVREREGVS